MSDRRFSALLGKTTCIAMIALATAIALEPLKPTCSTRVVSYKERKNFIELVGEGALCLRNSSETKFASDRNKEIV
jgi:hypothetical protein